MQTLNPTFTIAEYCQQMEASQIKVNHEYQRSPKVWPPAARSYLIDTILQGYPIPKVSLYQKFDLKSKQTIKEIVDGQQRSQAILDFYQDNLRLSVPGIGSAYSGKKYSQLDEADQVKFLNYALSVDLFVGATDDEIRQVFRRINSYTIPLKDQEKRHAAYQGEFKWFIVSLSEKYAQALKDIGSLTERHLIRMVDADLFTEIVHAIYSGIVTKSEPKLEKFYADNDAAFPDKDIISQRIDNAFEWILRWQELHNTPLMKSHNIYSLVLAVMHRLSPIQALLSTYNFETTAGLEGGIALTNLSLLAAALSDPESYPQHQTFIDASTRGGTDTQKHRITRFKNICRALESRPLA